jgi:Ca2+-binding RTX toxin-like protein
MSSSVTGVNVSLVSGVIGIGGDAAGDTLIGIENLVGTNFADTLAGNEDANRLDGDLGIDTVSYSASNAGVNVNLGTGAVSGGHAAGDTLIGIENIIGSAHGDTLIGDGNNNVLEGGAGADYLDGGGNTDTASYSASNAGVTVNLNTGAGSGGHATGDTLSGIENLIGSAFNDSLIGNGGDNMLDGGVGADYIDGGGSVDTASYSASSAGVSVNLSTGVVSGGDAAGDTLISIENLIGSAYDDILVGDGGNNLLEGGAGADYIDGGAGVDTVSYSASSAGVSVDLSTGAVSGGDAAGDTLTGIENLGGSKYNDFLTGDINNNQLFGNDGNDTLYGMDGNDTLFGGLGQDHFYGGAGNDVLNFNLTTPELLDVSRTVQASKVGMIDGGSGEDSLILGSQNGLGATLDISTLVGAGKLTGIERIDITGDVADPNTLRLTASDVLAMSDTDTVRVDGDANDTVQSSGYGWTNLGTVTLGSHEYNHYTATVGASTVTMYVDVDILTQTMS